MAGEGAPPRTNDRLLARDAYDSIVVLHARCIIVEQHRDKKYHDIVCVQDAKSEDKS